MALEYPEMSVIAGQMSQALLERSVSGVIIRDPQATAFRWGFSNLNLVSIVGETVQSIHHFGDNIFVSLRDYQLVFGDMIGKILYHQPAAARPPKATIVIELNDGAAFSYNPSLYGYCKALTHAEAEKFLPPTWVQPLDPAFTPEYLAQAFAEPERKIAKQMNIYNVRYKAAGVGNGYWQEVLFECGVHPQRKARQISSLEIETLHSTTVNLIRSALQQGGAAGESNFFGGEGAHVRSMGGKWKGLPCPKCGQPIQGKNILGANVYFCASCQK